jgi:hypothetical protein
MPRVRHLAVLSILLLATVVALPQGGPLPATNQPFVAIKKLVFVQKLADGTTINQESTMVEARDSAGRVVHTDVINPIARNHVGATTVVDPVAHTTTSWGSTSTQANRFHLPDPSQPQQRASAPAPARSSPPQPPAVCSGPSPPNPGLNIIDCRAKLNPPEFKTEKLGSKTLAGLYVEGTRTTITSPVGRFGNDKPIVQTTERWINPDLHLTVSEIIDDPRMGLRTTELINLDRREPDPILFQIPDGYTVREQYPDPPRPRPN